MKLNTFYVEGDKFYWLNLQRKVQIFVGSMTGFNKCSLWAPPVTLHTSSRYSSSSQTRCSMSSVAVSSAGVILCFISSMLAGRGGTKTSPFTYPLRKKSHGERSGDRVGHFSTITRPFSVWFFPQRICERTSLRTSSSANIEEMKQRITPALETVTEDMLQRVWLEL